MLLENRMMPVVPTPLSHFRQGTGESAFTSYAQAATFAHHSYLRRDHLCLERRRELLRLRKPQPKVGQASLFIALQAPDLHFRRQARLPLRNQLQPPHQLRHQLTLVP